VAEVTVKRVAEEQQRIEDVLASTGEDGALPGPERDARLAECCAGACGLLRDWLVSDYWRQLQLSDDAVIGSYVPDQQLTDYLGAKLDEVLARTGRPVGRVAAASLADAQAALAAAGGHHRRKRLQELYLVAGRRVSKLTSEVCALADLLRDSASSCAGTEKQATARRKRARVALAKVGQVLRGAALSIVLFMAATGPQQAAQALSAWEHEAVKAAVNVVVLSDVAAHADPALNIGGPGINAQPGPG
jgi:hypothetical protein